jgi:anaerobic magnesium-protoporphyrin IX monomethyl ester cyclase
MIDLVLSRPGADLSAEDHWGKNMPLGIGYLASAARNAGLRVAVVDGKSRGHRSVDQTAREILAHNPRVVGLSALTNDYLKAKKIAKILKNSSNPPVVVFGGAHVNALPESSLNESTEIDYIITGESETSLVEFVKYIINETKPANIPGLYIRENDDSVSCATPARFDHNISDLSFPAWDLFPRSNIYPVMAERGCPYNCVFCSNNMSRRVRYRPISHVIEELSWLHRDYSPQWIYFEDETFGLNQKRTEELVSEIIEFNRNKSIRFKAQTRADCVSEPLIRLMKQAGFKYLEIGAESGNQNILDNSGKSIKIEQIENAVRIMKKVGIKIWLKFIVGLPGETIDTFMSTIRLAAKLNADRISVAIIVAYPGSQIYEWAQQGKMGYRFISKEWDKFDKYLTASVELDNLSYPTMRKLQLRMYLDAYLKNYRIVDLSKLVWNNRNFIYPIIKSFINTAEQSNEVH